MSLSYVVDGETELDSELFNPIIDRVNGDAGPLANMRAGIFNVLDYGAVGDGAADDTVAIQDAIDACIAAGGGVVDGSGKRYKIALQSTLTLSSIKYALMVWGHGVTMRNMTLVMDDEYANGHCCVLVSGHAKAADSFATADMVAQDFNFNPDTTFPIYAIDPASYLDPSVTLDTAGDAVNFAVGDVVYIRSGQTIPFAGEAQPDAELNIVTGIAGGVLSLAYPLSKNYVQEYFTDSDRDSETSTSVTAYPAYFGISNVNAAVIRGFRAENVRAEVTADTYSGSVFNVTQVLDPAFVNCTARLKNTAFQGYGPHRGLALNSVTVDVERTNATDLWFGGDKGCGDISCLDSQFSTYGTYGSFIHLNEGTANVTAKNSTFQNAVAFDASQAIYSVSGRGYRHSITNCHFNGEGGGALVAFDGADGVFVDACDLSRADTGVSLSLADSINCFIGQNDYGNGTATLHPSDADGSPTVVPRVLSTWCYHNSAGGKAIVGTLPVYATILDIQIYVYTAFNGGSPTIQVGNAGFANNFMDTAADVSTQGYATVSLQPSTQWQPSTAQVVTAWITPDGSSAGRAQVIVTYINGPVNAS